jgi:hypothetical protein
MPKKPTKAAGNVYCEARLAASSCNDRLASREGAAEVCGIDRTRLAHFELGAKVPHPEEVLLMADAYNAPELLNHHCANDCPIGKKTVRQLTLTNADRAVLNFVAAYMELTRGEDDIKELLIQASEKEALDADIMPLLNHTVQRANTLAKRAQELSLWTKKHIAPDGAYKVSDTAL